MSYSAEYRAIDVHRTAAGSVRYRGPDDGDARYRAFLVDTGVPMLIDTGLPDTMSALFEGLEVIEIEPERGGHHLR